MRSLVNAYLRVVAVRGNPEGNSWLNRKAFVFNERILELLCTPSFPSTGLVLWYAHESHSGIGSYGLDTQTVV